MIIAGLDKTYVVEDWFVKKDRLLVHVAKRRQGASDRGWRKRIGSWLARAFARPR
jgi:hypothetical protein